MLKLLSERWDLMHISFSFENLFLQWMFTLFQARKEWAKRIQHEWSLLEKDLPGRQLAGAIMPPLLYWLYKFMGPSFCNFQIWSSWLNPCNSELHLKGKKTRLSWRYDIPSECTLSLMHNLNIVMLCSANICSCIGKSNGPSQGCNDWASRNTLPWWPFLLWCSIPGFLSCYSPS